MDRGQTRTCDPRATRPDAPQRVLNLNPITVSHSCRSLTSDLWAESVDAELKCKQTNIYRQTEETPHSYNCIRFIMIGKFGLHWSVFAWIQSTTRAEPSRMCVWERWRHVQHTALLSCKHIKHEKCFHVKPHASHFCSYTLNTTHNTSNHLSRCEVDLLAC